MLGGISIDSFIYSSILFLLPTLIIECNKNPIIKRNDAKIAAEHSIRIVSHYIIVEILTEIPLPEFSKLYECWSLCSITFFVLLSYSKYL